MAEIIGLKFRYRLLFEPEHEFQTKKGHLICDKFITDSNVTKAQKQYFEQILINSVDNDWIAQLSNRKFKMHLWPLLPKKYIIKFVRCNLSALFINEHFSIPVFYIVRNPYDVILSQNRVKFPWLYNLDHFRKQKDLEVKLKTDYGFNWEMAESYSDIEILTLRWCIENALVLNNNKIEEKNFKVLKYETLKEDINMFLKLCREFNIEPLKNIENIYQRPSSKTHPNSNIRKNQSEIKADLTAIKRINKILDLFNITNYSRL